MWLYAARRLLMTIPIAIGVTVICFALIYLAPGNPIQSLLPPAATAQDVIQLKHAYGLDKPIPVQYLIWVVTQCPAISASPFRTTSRCWARSSERWPTPFRSR